MNTFKKVILKIINWTITQAWFLKRKIIEPKIPNNKDGKVYVNVGCGIQSGKEFTNVDTLPFPNIHYIADIRKLPMFADNSVDMVYASHVVEHIPRHQLIEALTEWCRILKPGGVFRMAVPDFDNLIKIYEASGRDAHSVMAQVMGQEAPYNNHHTIWNFKYAQEVLKKAGFSTVRTWDVATADHHDFEDRSSRVLKAGSVEVPLSLNVEGVK